MTIIAIENEPPVPMSTIVEKYLCTGKKQDTEENVSKPCDPEAKIEMNKQEEEKSSNKWSRKYILLAIAVFIVLLGIVATAVLVILMHKEDVSVDMNQPTETSNSPFTDAKRTEAKITTTTSPSTTRKHKQKDSYKIVLNGKIREVFLLTHHIPQLETSFQCGDFSGKPALVGIKDLPNIKKAFQNIIGLPMKMWVAGYTNMEQNEILNHDPYTKDDQRCVAIVNIGEEYKLFATKCFENRATMCMKS